MSCGGNMGHGSSCVDGYLCDSCLRIGKLEGKLTERERSRDELKRLLDAIQDDLDLMRERAVRAETELHTIKLTLKQIEGLKL